MSRNVALTLNRSKPSVKAVTFDVWETLLLEKNGWNMKRTNARCNNLARAFERLGIKVSVEQIAFAFREMTSWLSGFWETNRDVTHVDQIRFIVKTASRGLVTMKEEWADQLSSAYVSALFEVPPYLNPDAPKVLQQLKDKNKLIGIICNTGLTPGFGLRRFLTKEGLAKYFDVMLFSDEVEIRKPDSKMFQIAAQKLQVRPYQIVHIGDNLKSDVWGAGNAGLRTLHFHSESGRDRIAESDPRSLVSVSRKFKNLKIDHIVPDKTVASLAMVIEAIEELELTA
jgi:putative hydrolase of the HAD superfamily